MKRILFLTFYFEPDLCAGSFRNTPLAKKLAEIAGENVEVHVVTTQPNRYKSFRVESAAHEVSGNLVIDRLSVPTHKSGFRDQIKAFTSYFNKTRRLVKGKKYDLVFASSSRMFTAYLGKKIAQQLGCPLYLDIRDIFVDTITELLKKPVVNKSIVLTVKNFVERPTFRFAKHINLISEGFRPYFDQYPNASYSYYPHGIDEEFYGLRQDPRIENSRYVITYAGNIGEGQGLDKIIPQAAHELGDRYQFKIIGDGSTRELLEKELQKQGITNVELLKPMGRAQIIELYRHSHFLFLHLNDYEAFKKVLPSKVFEYGATNIPVVAGVRGFAAGFIQKNIPNSMVFTPCNTTEMVTMIRNYDYHLQERTAFEKQFSRTAVNEKLALSILSYLK